MRVGRLALLGLCLALVLSAVLLPGPVPADAAPRAALSDNLVAYWRLEESSGTRADELNGCGGSGCDLTDVNTVTGATGIIGDAAQFTGANSERLSHADAADLSVGDIDFTFGIWVYLDSKGSSGHARRIVGHYDYGVNQRSWGLTYDTTADRFVFLASPDGSASVTSVTANNFGSPSLSTWYYVVVWHDAGGNTLNIQVDGGTPNSAVHSTGVHNSTAAWAMGTFYNAGVAEASTLVMDGRLDEAGFWKRVLTADERTALYNAGAGCDYPFTACEATPTPTATDTPEPTDTDTPVPTDTDTPEPTDTHTPDPAHTATDTPEPTDTHTPGPTPTDTPTPGPDYWNDVQLSSGNVLRIERRWSYGELFVGLAVLVVAMVLVLRWLYDLVRQWMWF